MIAGAESRNAIAAAGVTPRFISAADTGTEAHSQPGRITPDALATGTARAGCLGSAFAKNDAGTNAVSAAESSTPSTRKGSAWTVTPTNMVAQVRTPSSVNRPAKILRPNSASADQHDSVSVNAIEEPAGSSGSGGSGLLEGAGGGPTGAAGSAVVAAESCSPVASAESAGVLMGGILTQRNAPGRVHTALLK